MPGQLTDKRSGCRAAYDINNSNITEFFKIEFGNWIVMIIDPVSLFYQVRQ
jgi:hypothetical protein